MDLRQALEAHDGVATYGELVDAGVRPLDLARAIDAETIARPHRGVYVLPGASPALAAARRLGGNVSHLSAARFHALEMLGAPRLHHITVPRARRKKKVTGVAIHRRDLRPAEIDDRWPVTDPLRTCLDCLRTLPLREALVVADSAARQGRIRPETLQREAAALRGNGAGAARAAAGLVDARHESPLESVACAEMHLAGLPAPEPQVVLDTPLGRRRVDFWFRLQRVGVETDGFETHGTRTGLLTDCERHNGYAVGGLLVVRFGFEHVMRTPALFTDTVRLALERGVARQVPQCARCGGVTLPTPA
jgi:very-short-patch-repair endonuclease